MTRRAVAVVVCAIVAALLPVPAQLVERWYSTFLYAGVQRVLTPLSNLAPFALFDALCVAAICAFAVAAYRAVRQLGWRRGGLRAAAVLAVVAASAYLVFLATWGLNYRRVPIVRKVRYEPSRITRGCRTNSGLAFKKIS